MSLEENCALAHAVIEEGFNKGNYLALDALFAPEYVEHQFGLKTTVAGFKEDIHYLRTAFPDFHLAIDDILAADDKVWLRMTGTGTNSGPYMGPPTGKTIRVTVMDVIRVRDGKIVEHWGVPDRFAVLAQLGRLP